MTGVIEPDKVRLNDPHQGGTVKPSEAMTPKEAARYLNVSLQTIKRYIRDGVVPAMRPSRQILRISRTVLEQMLRGER